MTLKFHAIYIINSFLMSLRTGLNYNNKVLVPGHLGLNPGNYLVNTVNSDVTIYM